MIPVGGQRSGALTQESPKDLSFSCKIDFYYALFYSSDTKMWPVVNKKKNQSIKIIQQFFI